MNKYLKSICNLVIYSIAYIVILFAVALSMKYLLSINPGFKDWFLKNQNSFIIINDIISIPIFALLVKRIKKQSVVKYCKFNKVNPVAILVLCLIGLSVSLFSTSIIKTPFITYNFPIIKQNFDLMFKGTTLVCFLLFLFIGSIYKEMLFRGIIFNELKEVASFKVAIVLQGLIYGVFFFQYRVALIAYGLLGAVLFALIYTWFDSIWAPVAAQITSTGGLYLLSQVGGTFIQNYVYLVLAISILIMIAGIYYLWKNKEHLKYEIENIENNKLKRLEQ